MNIIKTWNQNLLAPPTLPSKFLIWLVTKRHKEAWVEPPRSTLGYTYVRTVTQSDNDEEKGKRTLSSSITMIVNFEVKILPSLWLIF